MTRRPLLPAALLGLALLAAVGCSGPLVTDPDYVPGGNVPAGVDGRNAGLKPRRAPIRVGEPVPAFVLADQYGTPVTSGELMAAGDALIVFLPVRGGASRPVAPWVREHRDRLARRNCELLLVTAGTPEENAVFAAREELRVAVLSDPGAWVMRAHGVLGVNDGTNAAALDRPWTVIIGGEGRVLASEAGLMDFAGYTTALAARPTGRRTAPSGPLDWLSP